MQKDDCKLSRLPVEVQDGIEELSRSSKPTVLVNILKQPVAEGGLGVEVSLATLYRFLRRRAEKRLQENAMETNEAASGVAGAVNRKEFRKGTMALLQQRLYDEALTSGDTELVKQAYQMLSEEEAREVGLQLAERHTAIAEENAKAARRKAELAAANSALALLPRLQEILLREGAPDAEIVQEARKCLLAGGGELMRIMEKRVGAGID